MMYRWKVRRGRLLWTELTDDAAPELVALRDAVLAWGDRWRLRDDWILDVAVSTLREMYHDPTGSDSFAEPDFMAKATPLAPFEFRPLILESETDSEYTSAVLVALKEYCARSKEIAVIEGLLPVPLKKKPKDTSNTDLHVEWLVRHQVQGWSHKQIAIRYGRAYNEFKGTSRTVSNAVRKTADLIGLTLRTS